MVWPRRRGRWLGLANAKGDLGTKGLLWRARSSRCGRRQTVHTEAVLEGASAGGLHIHTHTMKDELNNTSKHRRDDKGRNLVRYDMDERSFILVISTTAGVTIQHKNSHRHLDRMISRSDREQRGFESKSMRCFKQHRE